jgi:hypothetical protein
VEDDVKELIFLDECNNFGFLPIVVERRPLENDVTSVLFHFGT